MAFKTAFWFTAFLFIVSVQTVCSQSTLRGIISDRQTGRPLEMANVTLQQISEDAEPPRGTITDANGLYQFNNVTAGEYIFAVSYVGFETHVDTLNVDTWGDNIVKHVIMRVISERLQEVTISEESEDDVVPGQITIRGEDFGRAPAPAGSADLAGYIQMQPGVVAFGDRGGQMFVRGGTPSENLVLMDGTLIYQPFHIIGFFSVFPEDVVSKADFYAGGFGPEFSSR
ncbi:MAG: carboxypeptidase regulatory-like domain-containing protein, partial [Balneolaceae bacterium]